MAEPSRLWTAIEVAKKLTETREVLLKADSLLNRINLANPRRLPRNLPDSRRDQKGALGEKRTNKTSLYAIC